MKKIVIVLVLIWVSSLCWGQKDGKMWFMGVPVEGTVENFEKGLAKKWNVDKPQSIRTDAQWATKSYVGNVDWYNNDVACVRVTYNPTLNLVWLVSLEFENDGVYEITWIGALKRFNYFKQMLKEKYPEVVPKNPGDYKCKYREDIDEDDFPYARWSFNEGLIVLSVEKAVGAGFGPGVEAYRVKIEVISNAGRKAALGQ